MGQCLLLAVLLILFSAGAVNGQGTTFTYQGQLTDAGVPASGSYDLQFKLFDDPNAGTQKGGTVTKDNVAVANGVFTTQLDFGAVFDGNARYLELGVRPGVSTGAFQMLSPRQALNAAPYALFSAAPWVASGSNTSYTLGNVGIGTTSPGAVLSVVRSGAPEPSVVGVPTGLKVGTPAGTVPLALREEAPESTTPTLAYFETGAGALGYLGANTSTLVLGGTAGKGLGLNVNASTRAASIGTNGNVMIGTSAPISNARLAVQGVASAGTSYTLILYSSTGIDMVDVYDDGQVYLRNLPATGSTKHVCSAGAPGGVLGGCASAAEYVPTIDSGLGFPETANLVSLAPAVKNPYGDTHSPFVVQKSSTPCDPNLLGFIVDPASGADGQKLNEHYLPLAIYGYFPAKVTLENGPIRRGDLLTSSSKAGYAMKATTTCKTIGRALEDANHDSTIQVFADRGESAAPEVAALRTQVQELQQANAILAARLQTLEAPNRLLEARLTALEHAAQERSRSEPIHLSSRVDH